MAANRNVADEEIDEVEEEAPRRRSNVLRLILLLLLILVGLCILCFLASRFLGGIVPIPSIPGIPTIDLTTPIVPFEETPTETPTPSLGGPSPEATTPPAPPTEQPVVTEEPATEQPLPTEEPATEEPATATPTSELIDEHGGEIPPEGTEPPTTVPVPGPTATPTFGPTGQADCANNQPPVADAGGPYNAMMGKGQAFVIFDGSGSSDADGTITSYEWDFGDGNTDSGQSVTYGYSSTGIFVATLTITDNCGATAIDQAEVTIVGPTPPSSGTTQP